jgi:hypothetical protein
MACVAPGPATRASRLAAADARWRLLAASRPDLQPAIDLQRQLVGVMLHLYDGLERGRVPRLSLPPGYLAAKLGRGVPALAGEPIQPPADLLGPALLHFCEALSRGGAGAAADHIHSAILGAGIDAGSLLAASLSRDRHAIQAGATRHGLSPDLLWLIAEMAASPFACVLQQTVMKPDSHPRLAAALDRWTHGYCPACGSWPALAEVLSGQPVLRCSFCSLAWTVPAETCAYCGEHPPQFETLTPEATPSGRGLQICRACLGYLKAVHVPGLSPFPLVTIADLETADLDAEAMERGFERPQLRELAAR